MCLYVVCFIPTVGGCQPVIPLLKVVLSSSTYILSMSIQELCGETLGDVKKNIRILL